MAAVRTFEFDYSADSSLTRFFSGPSDGLKGSFIGDWEPVVPPIPGATAIVSVSLMDVKPSPHDGVTRIKWSGEMKPDGSACRVVVDAWEGTKPLGMSFQVTLVKDYGVELTDLVLQTHKALDKRPSVGITLLTVISSVAVGGFILVGLKKVNDNDTASAVAAVALAALGISQVIK